MKVKLYYSSSGTENQSFNLGKKYKLYISYPKAQYIQTLNFRNDSTSTTAFKLTGPCYGTLLNPYPVAAVHDLDDGLVLP